MNQFKNIFYLLPVMMYYFIESLIISFFINIIWSRILSTKFGIQITYIEWVFIIWIIKLIFFDVFKLIVGLNTYNPNQPQIDESEKNNDDDKSL